MAPKRPFLCELMPCIISSTEWAGRGKFLLTVGFAWWVCTAQIMGLGYEKTGFYCFSPSLSLPPFPISLPLSRPVIRTHRCGGKRVEVEVALVTIKSGGPFPPCSSSSGLSSLKVLLLKGHVLLPKNRAVVLLNWKVKQLPSHFGPLTCWADKQRRKSFYCLG